MVVTSIDPWPPYRFSDDQVLELVTMTAIFENDSESAASSPPAEAPMPTIGKHIAFPSVFGVSRRRIGNVTKMKVSGVLKVERFNVAITA